MAYTKFPNNPAWPLNKYNDYGYDFVTDRVVSYKRVTMGFRLERRSSYRLNGWDVSHIDLRQHAERIRAIQSMVSHNAPVVAQPAQEKPKLQAAVSGPDFPYVMFSNANKASQYFFAGTTIAEALERFAKRGEIIDPAEAMIVNTNTGKLHKLIPTTIYKLAAV